MSTSMRRTRSRRRSSIGLHRIGIGDFVVLVAALMTVVCLFLPWLGSSGQGSQWAFTYSELAAVVVIVFFLATLFLVLYPALSADLNLPVLPVSSAVLCLFMGGLLLLLFTYELGQYNCVLCTTTQGGRGIGVWIGWIFSVVYLIGAVIKWGSRPGAERR